jgi:hypothetical protein
MERETFTYLVSNPAELTARDVAYLEQLVEQHPFCSLAYTLLAKGHADTGNELATITLRKAAAYALSRNALRKLLSGEFPAPRAPFSSVRDLLEGRLPERKTVQEPTGEAPKPSEEQPLKGFGLDYSDVLINEEVNKSPVVEEEKRGELVARLQQEQLDIIDRFIAAEPRIGPLRATPGKPDEEPEDLLQKRQPTVGGNGGLVTESFAKILTRQGKLEQAIGVYEKLRLKNPEKSAYFAQKIEELRSQAS